MHKNKYKKHSLRNKTNRHHTNESIKLQSETIHNMPEHAADYVATAIELLDLTKLTDIAKVEYVIPLLEELYRISKIFPNLGENHSDAIEILEWTKKLQSRLETSWMKLFTKKQRLILQEMECKTLELAVTRWLSNFRFLLKT